MPFTLATLLEQLGLPVPERGGDTPIHAIKSLHEAGPNDLSFLESSQFFAYANATKAAAVFVRPADFAQIPAGTIALATTHPYTYFARALQLMYPDVPPAPGISQFAVVSASAKVHESARVEPYAVIYANAEVGPGAHIGAHAVVGEGSSVGPGSRVGPHCTLLKTKLGGGCILHPGVRLGQDGFGFAISPGQNGEPEITKVPQIGRVIIGNNVEIGAGTTVDCGAVGNTIIEDNVKIDNQVQIGHNARIGKGTRIVAQVGVAGSTSVGAFSLIGGQVGIAGHLELAPKTMVAALSGITKSVEKPGSVLAGIPAVPINEWRRQVAAIARIAKNRVQTNPGQKSTDQQQMPHTHASTVVPAAAENSADETDTSTTLDPNTGNPFA